MSPRKSNVEAVSGRPSGENGRLRWLARIGRARGLDRSGGAFFLALTSVNVFNFGFHFLMSRLLGPSSYGGLAALVGIVAVLSIPFAAFEAAVAHVAAERPGASHVSLLRGTMAAGVVGSLGWLSLSAWTSYFLRIPVTTVLLLSPWVFFALLNSAQEGILIGRRHYRSAGVGVFVGTGVARLLSAVVLVEAGAGTAGAIASTAIGAAVCAGLLSVCLREEFLDGVLTISRSDVVRAISGVSGVTLLTSLDAWLARHFLTSQQAGLFNAAATAGRIALFLPSSLLFVVFPRFASAGGRGMAARRELRKAVAVTTLLSASSAALLVVAPHLASQVLFGSQYAGASSIIGIIAIADASLALLTVLIYYHMARRSKLASTGWLGCCLALILALVFHGTPTALAFAMLGASVATTGFMLLATTITTKLDLTSETGRSVRAQDGSALGKTAKGLAIGWRALQRSASHRPSQSPRLYSGLGRWPYLVMTASVAVVVITWWRSSALVWGSDGAFPIRLDEISRYFSFGLTAPVSADARKVAYILPWGVIWEVWRLSGLPWSYAIAQRIVEAGLLLASGVGAMRLSQKCWPIVHPTAAVASGLFYMSNLYTLTTVWRSQSNLMFHYSLLPIGVLVVLWAFQSGQPRKAALAAVVWTMLFSPAYMTTPIFVTDIALLIGLVLLVAVQRPLQRSKLVLSALTFGLVLAAMNAYWIYPLLKYFSVTFSQGLASTQGTASQSLFVLNSASLFGAIHLGGYYGLNASFLGGLYYPWKGWYTPLINLLGAVPLGFAVLAIVRLRTNKSCRELHDIRSYKVFFAALLTLSLFLVTGGHFPFGGLKVRIFLATHLLDEFRSVYARFMEYVPLAIAPLLAAGIHLIIRSAGDIRRRGLRWGATTINAVAALSAVVLVPLPMWGGWLYAASGPLPSNRIDPPQSYLQAARIVQRSAARSAVLALPISPTGESYLGWQSGRAGYTGVQPLSLMTSATVLDAADPTTWVGGLVNRSYTLPQSWCRTLLDLNVQYVFLDTDLNIPLAKAESVKYASDPPVLRQVLGALPCLKAQTLSSSVTLYRNTAWVPYAVYAASNPTGATPVAVHYRVVGADRLVVQVPKGKPYIIVNKPYDPNLRLDGRSPVGRGPLTAFRIPTPKRSSVVVSNSVTAVTIRLLIGASALALIVGAMNIPTSCRRRLKRVLKPTFERR